MKLEQTLKTVRAALDTNPPRPDFAQQLAERWLQSQPGHLAVSVLLAEALLVGGDAREAERVLQGVLAADPENAAALAFAAQLYEFSCQEALAWAAASTLRQISAHHPAINGRLARMARRVKSLGSVPLQVDMQADFMTLNPQLDQLEAHWRQGEFEAVASEAEQLLAAFPHLVKAHLILADCLMALGQDAGAVEHIHQAASVDPGAEVAGRLWADHPPFEGAWPGSAVPGALGNLPPAVASALGLNMLPAPSVEKPVNGKSHVTAPTCTEVQAPPPAVPREPIISPAQEIWLDIQAEINRLNGRAGQSKKQRSTRSDKIKQVRLNPVYVMAASKRGLQEKYGIDGWEQIDRALQALAKAAEVHLRAPAGVLYLDDAANLASFGLKPVDPMDAWAVKSLLCQMDERLARQQQEVGWLLLVGGPDLIAFHRLPNPADDCDLDVLSDNPYGCRDENYFVPQRAVGRLPTGAGNDPSLLLKSISTALAAHHAERRSAGGWIRRWWTQLAWALRGRRKGLVASFGYSASIWRKASLEVFRNIGYPRRLRLCPPMTANEFRSLSLGACRYGYFNLHGIDDGPAWYGQRDPNLPAGYPDYPVALRPEDLAAVGTVPEVVFSEACYGAAIAGRAVDSALCLKFLESGTRIMIGSTCVAYGGVNATLEAADQLALFFWQEIAAGYSGGRALQQAKVAYARHLDARQGYLDGEDQKTLISFVYYGDPTLTAPTTAYGVSRRGRTRTWKRLTECPPTVCSKRRASEPAESVPEELVQAVRNRVAGYLPGMENAKLTVTRQKLCQGRQCERPCNGCDAKTSGIDVQRMLFTMRQTEQAEGAVHQRLVKVTVDQHGKMVKMAVSK